MTNKTKIPPPLQTAKSRDLIFEPFFFFSKTVEASWAPSSYHYNNRKPNSSIIFSTVWVSSNTRPGERILHESHSIRTINPWVFVTVLYICRTHPSIQYYSPRILEEDGRCYGWRHGYQAVCKTITAVHSITAVSMVVIDFVMFDTSDVVWDTKDNS